MAKVYKSICSEMDSLCIKILNLSEKGIECKLELEKLMNDGFVNIAKARYIMGSKCVSTLQLPTENSSFKMQAMSTVSRKKCKNHFTFNININKPGTPSSEERIIKDDFGVDITGADTVKEMLQADADGLRKRNQALLIKDENYQKVKEECFDDSSAMDSSNSSSQSVECVDPIRMFGVLVPYTLRIAQRSFKDSLSYVVKSATIQSELSALLKRYQHLMEIKILIEKAAVDRELEIYKDIEYWTSSESSAYTEPSESSKVKSETYKPEFPGDILSSEGEITEHMDALSIESDNKSSARLDSS